MVFVIATHPLINIYRCHQVCTLHPNNDILLREKLECKSARSGRGKLAHLPIGFVGRMDA